MFGDSKKMDVITDREKVQVEKAQFTDKFSSIDFDEDKQEFWASIDKVLFETPYEIITKVLQANGYAINVENILAAIDSLRISIKATGPQPIDEEPLHVKAYTPGVHFKMPQKNAKGKLLQEFYAEIQAYEAELARLQQFEQEGDDDNHKNEAQLIKENRQLRQMNDRLAAKVDELTHALITVKKQQAASTQAFAEAEKLPVNIKIGKVKNVSIMDRAITVKTETHAYSVSMLIVDRIPQTGESALLYLQDGAIKSVYFYESTATNFSKQIGRVLYRSEDAMKVMQANRSEVIFKARTEEERNLIRNFVNGDQLLLYVYENQVVKYEKLNSYAVELFSDRVNEEIVKYQISGIAYEKFIGNAEQGKKEEEAA